MRFKKKFTIKHSSRKKTVVDWHSGFYGAIGLEFIENESEIDLYDEKLLNHHPLRIDLLVVKKKPEVRIDNEVGDFFLGHNVMEYKSEDDELSIDTIFKANAYASLYKAYAKRVDEIKADDITVTLARISCPRDAFIALKEYGYFIDNPHKGIYIVTGRYIFPTQIIVMGELDPELHYWLTNFRKNISEKSFRELIIRVHSLESKLKKMYGKYYFSTIAEWNQQQHEKLKGDASMTKYLEEFYKEELEERERQGRIKTAIESLKAAMAVSKEFGHQWLEKMNLTPAEKEQILAGI